MKWVALGKTDVGRRRENNEDVYHIDADIGLFIVCDGMGGKAAGEIAATVAISSIIGQVRHRGDEIRALAHESAEDSDVIQTVEDIICEASRKVLERAESDVGYTGMGTTITMMLAVGGRAVLGHVGDSRLYLLRGDQIYQLSDDHTFPNEMVRLGSIPPENAKTHPYAHVLTRTIGQKEAIKVDTLFFDVIPGDRLLLCSDGLTNHVSDDEINDLLNEDELSDIPQKLVDRANALGGKDNITAIVVEAESDQGKKEEETQRAKSVSDSIRKLQSVPIFDGLKLRELLPIWSAAGIREFSTEGEIIEKGEQCDSIYLLLEGSLSAGGSAELTPGDTFGVDLFLTLEPAPSGLRAKKPSRVMMLDRNILDAVLRRRPRLGTKIYRNLAKSMSLELSALRRG